MYFSLSPLGSKCVAATAESEPWHGSGGELSARKSTKRAVFQAFLLLAVKWWRRASAFGCAFKRPIYYAF
jgi:hypothetical protein